MATVADTPRALWDETFAVNVSGPASLTRALLPALRAAHGRIVFVNAAPGLRAVPKWSAYTASKAALRELADSLREEERGHGLRVTTPRRKNRSGRFRICGTSIAVPNALTPTNA